jgi:hypothetical protein
MSNRELFETDSWIGKKMRARFGALAVHFAQGTTTPGRTSEHCQVLFRVLQNPMSRWTSQYV